MNYKETEKYLEDIRRHNEVLLRMAISHLMDVGIRHLTDDNIAKTCEEIRKKDDTLSVISNDMSCAILETAGKLAKLDHIYLLVYISKHIKYSV